MIAYALIVAAGRGNRAGGDIPKQYQYLAGKPVLWHTISRFHNSSQISGICLVIHPDDEELAASVIPDFQDRVAIVHGDDTRDGSVRLGLAALPQTASHVLIHDGARPLVSSDVINRVMEGLKTHKAVAPAVAVTDALWTGAAGKVTGLQPRDGLWRAQTPQGFAVDTIRAAHRDHGSGTTDDVAAALAAGVDVAIAQGDEDNVKITHPGDFERAERILKGQ